MPVILQIKGGENIFNPIFEDWDTEEELCRAWQVCTKVKDSIENGNRMENLSWRLWYLHQKMVKKKNLSTKEFKKMSTIRKIKFQEFEPQNKLMFQRIKNKYIESKKKNKNNSNSNENQDQKDKDLKEKIKEEPNTTPIFNDIDNLTAPFSLNESMLSNNQDVVDFIKMKNNGVSGMNTLGLPLNKLSFNQNPDTLVQDDYSTLKDLFNHYPTNQANIPAPQPPNLHIPDQSMRTEFSEIYLNKYGRLNDFNSLYSNLYDDGINNEDPAFNNIFNKLNTISPALTQHSSFTTNSFSSLTPNQKLNMFNSSTDSLSNNLSFSSTIPDDNISISLMNQLSTINDLNSTNLSSFSDLTNTSSLSALNTLTNTSPNLLGLSTMPMGGASTLGVFNDITNPAALTLDSTNDFTTSLLNDSSLLTTSLHSSLSGSNSNSLSSTLVDTATTNTNKATVTSDAINTSSKTTTNNTTTNLNDNAILSAIQGKGNVNGLFPISTPNSSSILTSQSNATTATATTTALPLNIFNNSTIDSMIIPVTGITNTSIPSATTLSLSNVSGASVNGNSLGLDMNGLDLNSINSQLLMKSMLSSPLAQDVKIEATTATTLNEANHLNTNTKLSNGLVVPYDIQTTTTNTAKALETNTKPDSTKTDDKNKLKPVRKEINTPTVNKKLVSNTKEKTNGLSNKDIIKGLLMSQNNNLSPEQIAMYSEQLSKLTATVKNTSDSIKKQNTSPSLINSNTVPKLDVRNTAAQLSKIPNIKEDIKRLIENIKTTQANLLLNPTTQSSLLSSLVTNPLYKNLSSLVANVKLPIRADGPTTPKTAPPILNNKTLSKNQKNDKLTKGKTKKGNNPPSSASVTPTSAQSALAVSTPQSSSSTLSKSILTPENMASLQKAIAATPTSAQPLVQTPTQTQQQQKSSNNNSNKKKVASAYINQKTAAIDSMATQPVKPVCANCGVNHTPLWRRSANDEILCNACGLYQKLHKVPRPKSIRQHAVRKDTQVMTEHETIECSNCHTTNTPLWRRDENGSTLCNACGLYQKMHHSARPISMKTDLPRKRQRFDSIPNIPGMGSPSLLTSPGLSSFLPYGNYYPLGFGGLPGNSQFMYNPLNQAALSPALSDKSDKSSKSKKKVKTNQTPVTQKKIKLSNPSPTVV
jgi:hypothetical protein